VPGGIPQAPRRSGPLGAVRFRSVTPPGNLITTRIINGRLRLAASDLANFLACRHLTRLDLLHARRELDPPQPFDAGFQDLVRRGQTHEREVLERFRADGLAVITISEPSEAEGARATAAAIRDGADVIYQAVLTQDQTGLLGRPDFLVRAGLLAAPDGEPRPGAEHYEVVDAKLARSAKARAVAQTAFYSHLLAGLQGVTPRWMHLALGNGEMAPLRTGDYAAYERQIRRALLAFIGSDPGQNPPADPYPEPVEHCAICRWSEFCAARRRRDDDLSLVAGMTAQQRRAMKAAGVATRRGFAGLDTLPDVPRAGREPLQRAQLQARLQVVSEDRGAIGYQILDPERDPGGQLIGNRGLAALPEPCAGDLFFDIEGARYYSEDNREFGLQYLFGLVDTAETDDEGVPRYTQIWAFDRAGEKEAFENLIDFITERRERNPGLHVYHYNHYEPTSVDHLTELHETRQEAVGRLMGRFATREDEVDDLFRLGVFVDLYRVVRQALRAGVESYSIKRLEPLCGYQRRVDLRDATAGLVEFEAALDDGTAADDSGRQQVVAGYNEDDCRATLALRDWLEERRRELAGLLGQELPRPAVAEEPHVREDADVTRVRAALLASVPAAEPARTGEQRAQALLADLLDWHWREAKPAWWRYFYVRTLSPVDLIGEPDAIGGLTGGGVVDHVKRSVVRRFGFPPQEHRFSERDTAYDPVSGRGWSVWAVDDARGTIDLKIASDYAGPLPAALAEGGPVDTRVQARRLLDLGERVAKDGALGLDAATALLRRLPPGVAPPQRPSGANAGQASPPAGWNASPEDWTYPPSHDPSRTTTSPVPPHRSLRGEGEEAGDAAVRLALALRGSYLPIQGPPGTGKTYTAARQVVELVADGRTVGITGPSHAVIHLLIGKVLEQAAARGVELRIGQRAEKGNPFLHPGAVGMEYDQLEAGLRGGGVDIGAGTAWMWARPEFAGSVDALVVDEAGQMSLADTLAVAGAAGSVVLLGDPQQLAQPSRAAHPPGAGVSALEHILGERATMPADAGLLIDRTRRMHPDLCRFTSELFYDGKLTGVDGLELQRILGERAPRSGLAVVKVAHEGNANSSPEEAAVVARLVSGLLGCEWQSADGGRRPVTAQDVLVVTPYNAQIRAIQDALAAAGCGASVKVGTVDKFQGREAPVAIYSMATSSAEEAPRGLEFLYDPHRLNVATSRARALAIIVASPALVEVFCRNPRQMLLANALCRAWESASEPTP
jgi:predicted RecB family nuclease